MAGISQITNAGIENAHRKSRSFIYVVIIVQSRQWIKTFGIVCLTRVPTRQVACTRFQEDPVCWRDPVSDAIGSTVHTLYKSCFPWLENNCFHLQLIDRDTHMLFSPGVID